MSEASGDNTLVTGAAADGALVLTRYWLLDANGGKQMTGQVVSPPSPTGFVEVGAFDEMVALQTQMIAALRLEVEKLGMRLAEMERRAV